MHRPQTLLKTMNLSDLLKDSAYKLSQFKPAQIAALEAGMTLKTTDKATTPYVTCLVRGKPIKLTPEEAVRQLYVMVLKDDLGYPVSRMELEYGVTFGREKKRADICIFDKDKPTTPYILVELKKPKLKDGKEQLKSYCNATGAPMGVWSNGESISFYHRKDPNYFEDILAIPSAHEKLSDVLCERWTIDDLVKRDKLVKSALPDNHVTVLRTDAMSPICLALYLNSKAGQYQVDQHFKGSSGQIELYPADIANFWCPDLDQATQQKIDKLAQQSFTLKAQSARLLEAAKRAVEIAIEQNEAAGMAYLAREGALA